MNWSCSTRDLKLMWNPTRYYLRIWWNTRDIFLDFLIQLASTLYVQLSNFAVYHTWMSQHHTNCPKDTSALTTVTVTSITVCWWLKCLDTILKCPHHTNYPKDTSALTTVSAAPLRQKLRINHAISPSHSILTLGQPVTAQMPRLAG